MPQLHNKKLSIPYIIGIALFTGAITFVLTSYINKKKQTILENKFDLYKRSLNR